MSEASIPVGSRMVPVSQATTEELRSYAKHYQAVLESEGRHLGNYAEFCTLDAVLLVLEDRENTESAQRPATLSGFSDPVEVTRRLRELEATHHLVSPVRTVEYIPDGFGVEFSFLQFTPNDYFELEESGDFCLRAGPLKMLAGAANLQWEHAACMRKDDGRELFLVRFAVSALVDNFDGTPRRIPASAELDWRDGSKLYERLKLRSESAAKFKEALRLARFNLHEKAETAAKLRAICDLGIKRRYEPSEMMKPFAVAKLSLTGESQDPEVRRAITITRAQAKILGQSALFGPPPAQERPKPPAPAAEPEPDYSEFDSELDTFDEIDEVA